ncbi:uridine kinase family protein [Streptosporangium lutulentum]|uniref:Uridine kinase n=1 Tax=Streptosporangium lutulentum TaxID=1461250 RepID=A0ABT9QUM8_9ACTN|nr:hypothetical protein [Streptosporangium lutulentum]MDP9850447.1 uridine kinase [Streptosporangium lutulentum]
MLAISGIPGAGKTEIARRLSEDLNAPVVQMDHYYRPAASPGAGVDFSDPRTLDVTAVCAAIDQHRAAGAQIVIVEGIFALTLDEIRSQAFSTVWVDVPFDVGLARKLMRKLAEGADIGPSIRGYLERGRAGYLRHVLPAAESADLRIDGTQPLDALIGPLIAQLRR